MFNSKDEYLKCVKEDNGVYKLKESTTCPIFFAYGTEKPIMFHSDGWIDGLNKKKNCKIVPIKSGHWVMTDKPKELNDALLDWLQ